MTDDERFFQHRARLQQQAGGHFLAVTAVASVFAVAAIALIFVGHINHPLFLISVILAEAALSIQIVRLAQLRGNDGYWEIYISPERFFWQTPEVLKESSLDLPLTAIDYLQYDQSRREGRLTRIRLQLKNGESYRLNWRFAGVDGRRFLDAARSAGLKIRSHALV